MRWAPWSLRTDEIKDGGAWQIPDAVEPGDLITSRRQAADCEDTLVIVSVQRTVFRIIGNEIWISVDARADEVGTSSQQTQRPQPMPV